MNTSKKLRRLALATAVIAAAPGCNGLSAGKMNPFARSEPKVVETEEDARMAMGLAPKEKKSFFARSRDAIAGAFAVKQTNTEAVSENDPLSLANRPDSLGPEVYIANGQLWESSGSFDRAAENYKKALEVDPKCSPALGALARMMERQNKLDESVAYFEKAIEADPSDATLYNDLGLVYARQKQHGEAIEQIQRAIAIAPTNKRFANNIATVYMDAGKPNEAMSTLSKAHEPAIAQYNMAYLNFKRQQVGEARQHLQTALKIDPNLEPARNLLDRLGGSQLATTAKETIAAAAGVGQNIQQVSDKVQGTVQSVTNSVSSGAERSLDRDKL